MSAPRIIHISDLHFIDADYTWNWAGGELVRKEADSAKKARDILAFLVSHKPSLGTDTVVITGDLTDCGGEGDYRIARDFIGRLRDNGFAVHAIPGNHDYCWLGNIVFEDIFRAVNAINAADIADKAYIKSPGAIRTAIASEIEKTIRAQLAVKVPGIVFPAGFVSELADLFSIVRFSIVGNSDTVDNNQRRERFIQYITPGVSDKYPRFVPVDGGYLILLDSMQAELDEKTGDLFAQGKLGEPQLSSLKTWLEGHRSERKAGKKFIVCVHHTPFHLRNRAAPDGFSIGDGPDDFMVDSTGGLGDARELLSIIRNQVDCLLFGHKSPEGTSQLGGGERGYFRDKELGLGIPLINCENLEMMSDSYPISVLDLGGYQRLVYQTDGSKTESSWGHPHLAGCEEGL